MLQDNKTSVPFKSGTPELLGAGPADSQCQPAHLAGSSTEWPIRARFEGLSHGVSG